MSYPTPDQLRQWAKEARLSAAVYREEGRIQNAESRERHADDYCRMADAEEWRLKQKEMK